MLHTVSSKCSGLFGAMHTSGVADRDADPVIDVTESSVFIIRLSQGLKGGSGDR